MIFRSLAWAVWGALITSTLFYIPVILSEPKVEIDTGDWFTLVAVFVKVTALIELGITLLIRKYAFHKPSQRGTFDPESSSGGARLLFVSLLIWIISSSISGYGIILYFMSDQIAYFIFFMVVSLGMMVYHAPRIKPYKCELSS